MRIEIKYESLSKLTEAFEALVSKCKALNESCIYLKILLGSSAIANAIYINGQSNANEVKEIIHNQIESYKMDIADTQNEINDYNLETWVLDVESEIEELKTCIEKIDLMQDKSIFILEKNAKHFGRICSGSIVIEENTQYFGEVNSNSFILVDKSIVESISDYAKTAGLA